jgi:dipeptidyl aminopeptidase/acylaminoacyl peptidase
MKYLAQLSIILLALVSCAEKADLVTLEDYKRAESYLSPNTTPMVYGSVSSQTWLDGDRLIYRVSVKGGSNYMLANPVEGTKELAFDHEKLANALSEDGDEEILPLEISLSQIDISPEGSVMTFNSGRQRYEMDLSTYELTKLDAVRSFNEILSPDGKLAAYIRDYNLWVRSTETDQRTQLTFDGEKDYGYATNNAGWIKRDSPVLLWSPDSRKIATFRHDGRGVGEMYLWSTKVGHPELEAWKYPLPGDSLIFRIERIVIDLDKAGNKVKKLNMPPDPHRSTTSDHIAGWGGRFLDVEWSEDSKALSFVSSSRDHKVANLKIADPESGDVRSVIYEEMDTYLTTGELKYQITEGEWVVLQINHIDKAGGWIYFLGSNREEGDPYFQYQYRVRMDGTELSLLSPENANHQINWNKSNTYFTDSYSTPIDPATTVIRNTEGEVVMELEKMDITDLVASGWVPPIPFTVKARDSITDLYGIMYKPSNFDPSKKYPILNYLYPGPQSGSVGSRSFTATRRDKQAVAELGFVVVEVDAMGTPGRSKSFHDAYYGNMGDNGLPDQIITIKQLAAENPWMDIDRVGIWGHSGGGFASTDGILRYPDFYKVAVSGAGNHDNRNYEDDWGEKWQGLLVNYPSGGDPNRLDMEIQEEGEKTNYDNQANQLLAGNLKGKLLIAHGMMDGNVHPSNTFLVVQALIEAEKDFDMLVFPEARHGFGNSRYFMKRRWDYFVEHLKYQQPPEGFVFADNIR